MLTLSHAAHTKASAIQPKQHPVGELPSACSLASGSHGLHTNFRGLWDSSLVVASVLASLSVVVYVPTALQFADLYCKCYLQYYYSIIEYSPHRIVRLLCGASELISRRGRLYREI